MPLSLNCLFLGETSFDNIFPITVADKIISDNTYVPINEAKIGQFKNHIWLVKRSKFNINDPDKMNLWKVNIGEEGKLVGVSTQDDIKEKLGGTLMSPRKLFKSEEYFPDNFSDPVENVHIIISLRTFLAQLLPEKLEFRGPHPLVKSSGSSWDFQASDALKGKLKDAIHDHFNYWKAGQLEKTKIPQYFILAGAGEGKSRTAQELPKLLIECTNDVNLQNRLKSALIFNLSFENGTKLLREDEAKSDLAISNRMLFQLLKQPNETWNDFKNRYDVTPEGVLRRVAKNRNQEFNDLNVIIVLDGLQVAMCNLNDGKNKDSFFYNCISLLGILSLSGPFVVVCFTATISMPIHHFLASSQQNRVFLPVSLLNPPTINDDPIFAKNPVIKMLIDDMGGHGRALEALGEAVKDKDLDRINYIDLINDVRSKLKINYSGWLSQTAYLRPILRIVLSHTPISKDQDIFGSYGNKIKIDDIIQFGLVRFESSDPDQTVGTLSCPYIWLWIMAHANHENVDDPLLRNWDFTYYNEIRNDAGEPSIPPGCQYWQHFEHFVTQFRSLKSHIYDDDEQVDLGVIHNGAIHNFGKGQSHIYNRKLALKQSVNQVSTKSEDYRNSNTNILCQDGMVNIADAKNIIINAPSAESGDSFCSVIIVETDQLQTETQQYNLRLKSISQKEFNDEYKKATSPDDIFLFYTTAPIKGLKLTPNSAIVGKENWKDYFGTFSGRCYAYAMEPPDINKATYTQLTGMDGIAAKRASTILEKRPFLNIDDCNKRAKIPRIYM